MAIVAKCTGFLSDLGFSKLSLCYRCYHVTSTHSCITSPLSRPNAWGGVCIFTAPVYTKRSNPMLLRFRYSTSIKPLKMSKAQRDGPGVIIAISNDPFGKELKMFWYDFPFRIPVVDLRGEKVSEKVEDDGSLLNFESEESTSDTFDYSDYYDYFNLQQEKRKKRA